MKRSRCTTAFPIFALAALVAMGGSARAETWPSLESYVDSCVLIVLCETEAAGKRVRYRVVETWKGVYSPDLFHHRPEEGYLLTSAAHGNAKPVPEQRSIFFFTARNHPAWTKGKLLGHSTCFRIDAGKVIYASTGDPGVRREYTLDEFRAAVGRQVREAYVESVRRRITGEE